MKAGSKLVLLFVLFAALLWPQAALAQGPDGNEYVFGGTYTLNEGETLSGDLYVFGGIATLEEGSRVNGDVILAGGTLQANGEIEGNIFATGGLINLEDTAIVDGDVNTFGAHLNRAQGARIEGEVNTGLTGPFQFVAPGGVRVPPVSVRFDPLWDTLWFFFRSFLWAALAVLVVMFLPRQTERISQTAVRQPLIAFGLGLLTTVILPLVLIVVAITIIGLPISLLGALLLVIAWSFGLIALGTEVGKRMAHVLNQEWALAVAAGVGTFVLIVVTSGIGKLIICVGWLVPVLVGMLGLGAVLLTRFGTQPYPTYAPLPPSTPPDVPPPATAEAFWPATEPIPPAQPPPPPDMVEPERTEDEDRTEGGARAYPAE